MFLSRAVDDSWAMIAHYRDALLDAFDSAAFADLHREALDQPLEHVAGARDNLHDQIDQALAACRQHGARLARLLMAALRRRTEHDRLVDALAPALGLAPLVEVADLLTRRGCPARIREQVALAVDPSLGAHRGPGRSDGRAGWLDVLLWLDDLPDGTRPCPPVLDYLDRVRHEWRADDEAGAAALGAWLTRQRRERGSAPEAADLAISRIRGILLDLDAHGAVWTYVAYLFGDGSPSMLFHDTMPSPSGERELRDRVAGMVDRCLSDRAVAPLLAAGVDLRFEFVLPSDWIWFPVDRVEVGGNEQEDVAATPLGASYAVVVRPRTWWRPKPGSPAYATVLRRFKSKRDHLRGGGTGEIRTLSCPTGWTAEELVLINESREVVGIALACDRDTTASPEKLKRCLRAHVLAIVWKRSGIREGDAPGTAGLEALLHPVENAPRVVHEQRLQQRADVSLIWHVEPIEPPDGDPFGPPELAAGGGAAGTS